ncbi:MAG: nucleotidyltransferase domain-containing protein [Bdellovibrionota bacterium]
MINASTKELEIIKNIIHQYLPNCEVRVFGSRITSKFKKFSDIDLALVTPNKIDFGVLSSIKSDFEESDLPYRVDVLDWNAISPEFKQVIEKSYEVLA